VRLGGSVVLLGLSYYLTARLGFAFRFQNSPVVVFWPPNALLIAALLCAPRSQWPAFIAAAAVAHAAVAIGVDLPAWRWSWQIAHNSLLAVGTTVALRRFAGRPLHFGSKQQVLAFILIAFAVPGLTGLGLPSVVRSALGIETAATPFFTWLRASLASATGILIIVPAILLWSEQGWRALQLLSARQRIEAALAMLALVTIGSLTVGAGPEAADSPDMLLLMLVPLLWAAVRFGPIGAATALFTLAALSMWGMVHQLGPFVGALDAFQVLSLQAFWVVLCVPVMLLSASIAERALVESALQQQRGQLAHLTRVATAGELSGLLAHELHQPLTAILANAESAMLLIANGSVDADELREILREISQLDQQAADVINRWRTFLKRGEPQFDRLELEPLLRDAAALGRSAIANSRTELVTDAEPVLPPVLGDRVQVLQVLVNLLVNACEAMSETPAGQRRLWLRARQVGEKEVEVQVADCGCGISPGFELRVFDPFFSTKPRGLGLGLSISRSIATAHGGRLWVENNSEGGATFHLVLPVEPAA